jgi:DNA-binding MarR family transcriptional regulator
MPDLRSMLDCIREIRDACDLDLLLFFHRHPRSLLTSEQLVAYLGYERDRVATSLDGLIAAGLLTRSQNPSHDARLYVLKPGSLPEGLFARFLTIAATGEGRQEALRLLGTAPASVA